jgi:hypothetical protein
LNTVTLVLLRLHFKLHLLQYFTVWSIHFCKPLMCEWPNC